MTPRASAQRLRVARRVYEVGLRALPQRLRKQRGDEMRELFDDLYVEAVRRSGFQAARFTCAATMRALSTGVAARLGRRGTGRISGGGARWSAGLLRDITYAARGVRRDPGFALVIIATLALAIGVNSTIFSLGRAMVFVPIPFEDPSSLIALRADNPERNLFRSGLSAPDVVDLAQRADVLSGLAVFDRDVVTLGASGELSRVSTMLIGSEFFAVTGLPLHTGRTFTEREHRTEAPVVLLSHGVWQRRFGGAPMLGETLTVGGLPHTVVGIVGAEVERGYLRNVEVWRPFGLSASADRADRGLTVFARLAPEATLEQAAEQVARLSASLADEHPLTNTGWRITAISLQAALVGSNALVALTMMGMAVLFVLLIACVNVANLMLARSARRDREIAVRLAMGAGRARVARQMLVEGALLATCAAAGGLLMTRATFAWLVAVTRSRGGLFLDLSIDPVIVGFALALGLATPLVFALIPALRGSRAKLCERLGDGARGHSSGPRQIRIRSALITGQVALALTLLIVSSLAIRSVIGLVRLDPGFDTSSTLTMWLDARGTGAPTGSDELRALHQGIVDATTSVSGVTSATLASRRPFIGGAARATFRIDGMPEPTEADMPRATITRIAPGYLEVTRVALEAGRGIASEDTAGNAPVALINRAARDRYWGEENPLGDVIRTDRPEWPPLRVAGVLGDTRNPDADQPAEPGIFVSLAQFPLTHVALMARTERDPMTLRDEVVAAVRQAAPAVPVEDIRTMDQVLHDDLSGDMAIVSLFGLFAVVALGLAIAGIYSVVAYSVSGRLREIGIRLALGARTLDVRRMVLGQGLVPVVIGILLGVGAGHGLSRLISGILYGVTPTDPATFLGAPLLLLAAAAAACLAPARRAARVDPVDSLRDE